MANLITEIFDRQAVIDNLNQLGELINSSLNAIVSAAPKLQSPIDYMTALKSVDEIEKESIKTAEAKKKALSDLDKLYQQADKAIQQYDNLAEAEFQTQTKLVSQYKEMTKEQRQLIEIERTRQQTMQNSNKLLTQEAKTEAELRMQTQQLIKASQSLRLTNADENKVREQLIAKINANKEALKGMTNEVSKQKDNIGNYKSAWEGVISGQETIKGALQRTRQEMAQLEALQATGVSLTAEQQKRYNELNTTMGKLTDIQGDMSARARALSNDYLGMTTALEGLKMGVNVLGAMQGATALLGNENEELQKTMAKVVAIQQLANTIGQIQKNLNKDSTLMVGLRVVKEKLLTTAIGEQTKAQLALNAAKLGFAGLLAGAVVALGVWIAKMESAKSKNAELAAELDKKAAESIGSNIAKITELKSQWDKLGGTLEEKKTYFEKYKGVLEELGLKFGNISELETFMNKHTDDYVKAITARAKADAARTILAEKSQEYLKNQLDFERQNIKGQQTFGEKFQRFILDLQVGRQEASKLMRESYEAEQKAIEDESLSLTDLIDQYSKEADELFAKIGLQNEETTATNNQTQANKDLKKSLEELAEEEELWAKSQLQSIFKNTTQFLTEQVDATAELIDKKKKLNEEAINSIEIEEEEAEAVKTLSELLKEQKEATEKLKKERKDATDDMVENIGGMFDALNEYYDVQQQRLDTWYTNEKEAIEANVRDEEERNKALAELEDKKTKKDKEVAEKRAEIKRKEAIFQNAVDAAMAISKAVASVGELLAASAGGDPYSAVARYIAAIAAGISAVTTVATLISQMLDIPKFEKGGLASADNPFIAGEKGREIGFGQRTGKVYDFASPAIYKAPEPILVKNAKETQKIINNEYNKDVTLQSNIVVKVIDNQRVVKYFKLKK